MDELITPVRLTIQRLRGREAPPFDRLAERAIGDMIRAAWLPLGIPLLLIALALLLWGSQLRTIDLARMNDLGLVSVLPGTFFAALLLLTLSFCLSLRQQALSSPLLLLHVLILIVILYGTTSLIEEVPRFESVWKHVGVSEYISRTGSVATGISAYFNWPGFFILVSFVTAAAGAHDPLGLAMWFPLLINVLGLGALLLIIRSATVDKRVIWLAAWLFYTANWIGQDSFSPQALNYLLYLMLIAIVLGWFKVRDSAAVCTPGTVPHPARARARLAPLRLLLAPTEAVPNIASTAGQRTGLFAILVLLFLTIVASHQLTPFAILGSIALLTILGRIKPRGLPLLLAVLTASWLSFMAK